jgi:hypothetical protein
LVAKIQDGVASPAPGEITLNNAISWPTFECNEAVGSGCYFQVERLGGGAGTVSADVATSDGTAVAGSDYYALASTATFPENKCHLDYEVSIRDDTQMDPDETFDISLSNLTGGVAPGNGGPAQALFTVSHRTQPEGPTWEATVNVPWLTLDKYADTGPSTVIVTANPNGLAFGTHKGRITVTASDATGSPQAVLVTFVVSPP